MYVQGAMAAASMLSANSKQKAAMKAAVEDAKLQRAKLERARTRQAGDFATNTQRAREAAQRREIQIESQRVAADSKIEETFAGSGISGTSVDELDNEINAQVDKNKQESRKALDQNLADQQRADRNFGEDTAVQATNIGAAPEGGGVMEQLQAGASGFATGAALVGGVKSATASKGKAGLDLNSGASISSFLGFE